MLGFEIGADHNFLAHLFENVSGEFIMYNTVLYLTTDHVDIMKSSYKEPLNMCRPLSYVIVRLQLKSSSWR